MKKAIKLEQFNYTGVEKDENGELKTVRITKRYTRYLLFFWRLESVEGKAIEGCQVDGLTYKDRALIKKAMKINNPVQWPKVYALENKADTIKARQILHRRKIWLYHREEASSGMN